MATYQDLPDEDILSLYEARDETAIAATEHRYGGYCRAIADRILRVREDAEECVNDTWLHTWNAIPPTHPSNLKGFWVRWCGTCPSIGWTTTAHGGGMPPR